MFNNYYDVIVAGGGISGFFAALSASRAGASVLLVEASNTLGGVVVEGPLEAFMTFHDENGSITSKLIDEFVKRLADIGGSVGYIPDTVGYCKSIVPYDREMVQYLIYLMLRENGVHLLLNSLVVGTNTDNKRIVSIEIINKIGIVRYKAKAFVDATGDGDLAYHAGAQMMVGRDSDGKVQPMTMLFRVSGVNTDLLTKYVIEHIEDFKLDKNLIALDNVKNLHIWGFGKLLRKGFKSGKLSLERSELQAMLSIRKGDLIINYTRYAGNPLDPVTITEAQVVTLYQAHELIQYLKQELPSFSNAYISHTGKIGIRESRRITGKYILKTDDLIHPKPFNDTVTRGAFPIDIHQPDGNSLEYRYITRAYNIPASCLSSKDFSNLFMCGRCISVTHEALASTRITATAMATGQASGVLSAFLALHEKMEISEVLKKLGKL